MHQVTIFFWTFLSLFCNADLQSIVYWPFRLDNQYRHLAVIQNSAASKDFFDFPFQSRCVACTSTRKKSPFSRHFARLELVDLNVNIKTQNLCINYCRIPPYSSRRCMWIGTPALNAPIFHDFPIKFSCCSQSPLQHAEKFYDSKFFPSLEGFVTKCLRLKEYTRDTSSSNDLASSRKTFESILFRPSLTLDPAQSRECKYYKIQSKQVVDEEKRRLKLVDPLVGGVLKRKYKIHWNPSFTRNNVSLMSSALKHADMMVEVRDARAPILTEPDIEPILNSTKLSTDSKLCKYTNKFEKGSERRDTIRQRWIDSSQKMDVEWVIHRPRILVLTFADKANPYISKKWTNYFRCRNWQQGEQMKKKLIRKANFSFITLTSALRKKMSELLDSELSPSTWPQTCERCNFTFKSVDDLTLLHPEISKQVETLSINEDLFLDSCFESSESSQNSSLCGFCYLRSITKQLRCSLSVPEPPQCPVFFVNAREGGRFIGKLRRGLSRQYILWSRYRQKVHLYFIVLRRIRLLAKKIREGVDIFDTKDYRLSVKSLFDMLFSEIRHREKDKFVDKTQPIGNYRMLQDAECKYYERRSSCSKIFDSTSSNKVLPERKILRLFVYGIWNVGKSSLCNSLTSLRSVRVRRKHKCTSRDYPGSTKNVSWLTKEMNDCSRINSKTVEVCDTPGLCPVAFFRDTNTPTSDKSAGKDLWMNLSKAGETSSLALLNKIPISCLISIEEAAITMLRIFSKAYFYCEPKAGWQEYVINPKYISIPKTEYECKECNGAHDAVDASKFPSSRSKKKLCGKHYSRKVNQKHANMEILSKRYGIDPYFFFTSNLEFNAELYFQQLAFKRFKGNTGATAQRIISDFRKGYLGSITIEIPPAKLNST